MKIFLGISLLLLFTLSLMPVTVLAAEEGSSCNKEADCGAGTGLICSGGLCITASKLPDSTNYRLGTNEQVPTSGSALITRIELISNWVFAIFLAISLIFILLAAFQFVTGGGDPAKMSEARQKLIYAAMGIAIALIAAGFPAVLRSIVT